MAVQVQVKDTVKTAVTECTQCSNICLQTITYCLKEGGEHIQPAHIQSMMDCAVFCQVTVSFLLRESDEFTNDVCSTTAEIAAKCAQRCEEFEDDQQMAACAAACRKAAEACRQIVSGF